MEIIRRIGRYDVLVDSSEPCGVYFEESALPHGSGDNTAVTLGKKEVLDILVNGDDYLPLTLRWELLDRCNFSCPFCYIVGHSFQKLLRFSEMRSHLIDLINSGLLFCTLTGGEVTIHPDFRVIYQFLKEHGLIVDVFSNGYAIDDSLIDLFRRYPPVAVEISLYSLVNARLHKIYGVRDPEGASKILDNVLRLKRAGINVICKTFLNTVTQSDIDAIIEWCKDNNIEHYSSSEITHAYDGTDLATYAVKKVATKAIVSKTTAICLPCKTKNYGSAINAAFSIYPCPSIMLPDCTFDIRQLGVAESLRRMKAFMRRFQDTEIKGACGSSGCASCMAYAKPIRNEAGEILHFAQP
jgi:MoaA/NifB/PqqE/SkfB family radical SAM enzyme